MSTHADRLLAGRAIFARVIRDDVQAVVVQTRETLEPLLAADEAIAAELPDGTRIGTVKRSKPKRTPSVTDEAALLAWVREHRPEELVESVNPGFVRYLLEQVRHYGEAVYGETGEIVPGVEMRAGSPSYLPQPDSAMVPVVRARLAELIGHGLLALPQREAS